METYKKGRELVNFTFDRFHQDNSEWEKFLRYAATGNLYFFPLYTSMSFFFHTDRSRGTEYIACYNDWKKMENTVARSQHGIKACARGNYSYPDNVAEQTFFTYNNTIKKITPTAWTNIPPFKDVENFKNNLINKINELTIEYINGKIKVEDYGSGYARKTEDLINALVRLRCGYSDDIPKFAFADVREYTVCINLASEGFTRIARFIKSRLAQPEFITQMKEENAYARGTGENVYCGSDAEGGRGKSGPGEDNRGEERRNDPLGAGSSGRGISGSGRELGADSTIVRQQQRGRGTAMDMAVGYGHRSGGTGGQMREIRTDEGIASDGQLRKPGESAAGGADGDAGADYAEVQRQDIGRVGMADRGDNEAEESAGGRLSEESGGIQAGVRGSADERSDAADYGTSVGGRVFDGEAAGVGTGGSKSAEFGEPVTFHYSAANATTADETAGGMAARFDKNLAAIRLLKKIENENRYATCEEQQILYGYSGWGGTAKAFDSKEQSWKLRNALLKESLTEREYLDALESTMSAFYTPHDIIDSMFQAVRGLGFEGGRILDCSMGSGNFFSSMPEDMLQVSTLTGVEIDTITARIASKLHPESRIIQSPYEKVKFDEKFDLIISNVPFAQYAPFDPNDASLSAEKFMLHDFFFGKSAKLLAEGGLIAFITSHGTLDKKNSAAREYIASRCELIGAVRLPQEVFKDTGTYVTTDIIFLKKIDVKPEKMPEWVYTSDIDGYSVNNYFIRHPENVLGRLEKDSRFGSGAVCIDKELNYREKLPIVIDRIVSGYMKKTDMGLNTAEDTVLNRGESRKEDPDITADLAEIRPYRYEIIDDKVYFRADNESKAMEYKQHADVVRAFVGLRNTARSLIDCESDDKCDEKTVDELRRNLNEMYSNFVGKYGFINKLNKTIQNILAKDEDWPLVSMLEKRDEETNEYVRARIFTERTIRPTAIPNHVNSVEDAFNVSLGFKGILDMEFISELTGSPAGACIEELQRSGLIYRNPEKVEKDNDLSGYETADEYLSGDVIRKYELICRLLKSDSMAYSSYEKNKKDLESVLPQYIESTSIKVKIGTPWIEIEDYEKFMYETFDIPSYMRRGEGFLNHKLTISMLSTNNRYYINNKTLVRNTQTLYSTYGIPQMSALEIFEKTLNMQEIKIFKELGKDEKLYDPVATALAKQKQADIKKRFVEWIFADEERKNKYTEYYNRTFNSTVNRSYDGSKMIFPGLSAEVELNPHQKDAVARVIRSGKNTLLGHCVGAGKSLELIASCMELRRLGIAKKPMIVVPKALTGQMALECRKFYPGSNCLLVTENDFSKQNRRKFLSRIVMGDYDAIVISHSQFSMLHLNKSLQKEFVQEQIVQLTREMDYIESSSSERWTAKQLANIIKKLKVRYDKLEASREDDFFSFDNLGIDYLFIDEAHEFKNLAMTTKLSNIAGISTTGALKTDDLYMKIKYLEKTTGRNCVVFSTGTPISNSITEAYSLFRYLDEDTLVNKMHLNNFDAWANTFAEVTSSVEVRPGGNGFRERQRLSDFMNITEMSRLYSAFADIVTRDQLPYLDIPILKNGKETIIENEPSQFILDAMAELTERSERIEQGRVEPKDDNMLLVCNDAKNLAIDARLYDSSAPDYADSKLRKCIDYVYEIYLREMAHLGTQVIFCDRGVPVRRSGRQDEKSGMEMDISGISDIEEADYIKSSNFSVYDFIKQGLIAKGIPAEEIAFIHDCRNDKEREILRDNVNSGRVRVVLGSTGKLGTGTNIQQRLCAVHELDVPWKPSEIEQREGRALRQGNTYKSVEVVRYITKRTFDAYNWQIIQAKQKFITQFQRGLLTGRTFDDVDTKTMTASILKAIATGNPLIMEHSAAKNRLLELQMLKKAHNDEHARNERMANSIIPDKIVAAEEKLEKITKDMEALSHTDIFNLEITAPDGSRFENLREAGEAVAGLMNSLKAGEKIHLATVNGFKFWGIKTFLFSNDGSLLINAGLENNLFYSFQFNVGKISGTGIITRCRNFFSSGIANMQEKYKNEIESLKKDLETARQNQCREFEHEDEYRLIQQKVQNLEEQLQMNKDDEQSHYKLR